MDIGGSLTKIAYYSTVAVKRSVVYPAEATTEKQKQNGKRTSLISLIPTKSFILNKLKYKTVVVF